MVDCWGTREFSRALSRALSLALLLSSAAACGSSYTLPRPEQSCAGVELEHCDIEPTAVCLGSALKALSELDAPASTMRALLARMAGGTVAVRREAGGAAEIVEGCQLDGRYQSVLGETGSGRLWVAERVLFAPSEVGKACQDVTHTVVALALGATSSDASAGMPRVIALLVPLPCPSVSEKRAALGCIGKGMNGRARVRRAEDLERTFEELQKQERRAGAPPARALAAALEVYALAPDRTRESVLGLPASVEGLRGLDVDPRESYLHTHSNWVIGDLREQGHEEAAPRFDLNQAPLFLGCFPELFDPAGDAPERQRGGRCWQPGSSEIPSLPAETATNAPARQSEPEPAATSATANKNSETSETSETKTALKCGLSQRIRALPPNPGSEAALARIKQRIRAGDLPTAKAMLEKLREQDPWNARIPFYLARTMQALGEDARGPEREYQAALALDPKNTRASVELAKLLFAAGEDEAVLRVANGGLKTAPKQADLLYFRALSLDTLGRLPEALAAYATAEKIGTDSEPKLHAAYGALLAEVGKGPEALLELRAALHSSEPALLTSVAEALAQQGAFDDCIQALDLALAKQSSARGLVQRAICKDGKKDSEGAARDYQSALAQAPKMPLLNFHYGLHLAAKDKQKALEHLDLAAAIAGERGVGPDAKRMAATLRGKE